MPPAPVKSIASKLVLSVTEQNLDNLKNCKPPCLPSRKVETGHVEILEAGKIDRTSQWRSEKRRF
jgi:hypothetical protein